MPETPEAVALELLRHVAASERWGGDEPSSWFGTDRATILDTYAECLRATLGKRKTPAPAT